ncbi:MAG: hypothetical protein K6G74_04720 [Bacilli bacterium]|nr:hypothetical protein [Bacilli bacterium]
MNKFIKSKKLGYWFMCAVAILSLIFFILYAATYEPGQYGHGHTMPNSANGQPTELVWIWALFAFLIQLGALVAPEHKWLQVFVVGALSGALFIEIQLCPTVLAAIGTGVGYEGGSIGLHLTYLILNIMTLGVAITACFLDNIGQEETETLKKTFALPRLGGAAGLAGVLVIVGLVLSISLSKTGGQVEVQEEAKPFVIDLQKEFGDKVDASYTFDPTAVHFTKDSNEYSTQTTSAIQTAVGSSYERSGANLVYCFEGAYAEGWQGDYSKHYAYLYLWDDGLYNGESNGTKIYGYWYDTEEGGEAGATLVMVDNRGRDNDMVCSVNTSKFYKWVTEVKSSLNNGRTIKAFGYVYYPTIGFYVDPGIDYVVVDTEEKAKAVDPARLGWRGIRVLNNYNVGAVFDADKNLKFSEVLDTEDPNVKKVTATWSTFTWDTNIYIGSAPAASAEAAA